MKEQLWAYVLGFGFALLVGQLVIEHALNTWWSVLGFAKKKHDGQRISQALGVVECTLYICALLTNYAQFIAVWLGLKTVVRWRHWESDIVFDDEAGSKRLVLGRNAYNMFLLGNALVVIFAVVGFKMIRLSQQDQWAQAIGIAVCVIVAALAFQAMAIYAKNRAKAPKSAVSYRWRSADNSVSPMHEIPSWKMTEEEAANWAERAGVQVRKIPGSEELYQPPSAGAR